MYHSNIGLSDEEKEARKQTEERAKHKIISQMMERQESEREQEAAQQEDAREKQEREETLKPKDIKIKNLRWVHLDKLKKDQRPDYVVVGDEILLTADVENGDGKKALFEMHDGNIDISVDPEQLVSEISSTVEEGSSKAEWKVSNPRSKKEPNRDVALYALLKVEKEYSDSCDIGFKDLKKEYKRGHFDDKAREKYPSKYTKEKEGYYPESPIYNIQKSLELFRYLPQNTANGVFGPKTEEAVKSFQKDAETKKRILSVEGKVEEIDIVTYTEKDEAGVVAVNTLKEIDLWKKKKYYRPVPLIKKGHFDKKAQEQDIDKYESLRQDNGHLNFGTPVENLQQLLKDVNAYPNSIDGWCGDHTVVAIELFQNAASKGEFLDKDNKEAEIDDEENFKDFIKGVFCPFTLEELEKRKKEKLKVKRDKPFFPLDIEYKDGKHKEGGRAFGTSRSKGKRAHAGCDLYAPLGKKVYAVADGVIKGYYYFYWKTFALEIQHGDKTVRYGEVQPAVDPKVHGADISKEKMDLIKTLSNDEKLGLPNKLKIGSKVKKGDHIGYVGQLYVSESSKKFNNTMLHFELYDGVSGGKLTPKKEHRSYNRLEPKYRNKLFKRRGDLLNPSDFIDDCSN